jgi:chaperonin GroES
MGVSMEKIIPMGERIILKPVKGEERTKSGIYLAKAEDKKEGIVESVGVLKDGRSIPLAKGDKVLYGGYGSEEVEVSGNKLLIVDFKDIIAKFSTSQDGI